MAMQKQTSGLLAKLGNRMAQAHEAHKSDETSFGIINLPAGISGGIAQLVTAKWDEYKPGTKYPGKPFVLLRGIAKLPREHGGVPVEGQGVMMTIPLCDTPDRMKDNQPRTFDDNYADLLNEFRKLGVNTAETGPGDVEAILQHLQQEKPHYRFSTRGWTPPKKKPTDPEPKEMVFTQFDGICEYVDHTSNGDATMNGVQDESGGGGVESSMESGTQETSTKGETLTSEVGGGESFSEFGDLASLAEAADGGDQAAQAQLKEAAMNTGATEEEVDSAESWTAVAEMVSATQDTSTGQEQQEAEAQEGEKEWEPEREQCYKYKPVTIDPKSKKKVIAKKPVEVEVTAVDKNNRTVALKNLENTKQSFKAVKWDDLIRE